jgi:hypothetical protein
MVRKQPNEVRGFVDQTGATLNQLIRWLRKIDGFRRAGSLQAAGD